MHEWHWSVYETSSSPFEEVCDPGFGGIMGEILEKHLWQWFGRMMGESGGRVVESGDGDNKVWWQKEVAVV